MNDSSGLLALFFGAAIIVHFAYRRFHEANLDTQIELGRLHQLLSVDAMRTRSVVRLSLISYTVGLLTIYFLLTAYVILVPSGIAELTASTQTVVGGQIPGVKELSEGLGAVPLGVALVIIGLGTSFPYIRKIEEWLRGACHRLAGIPTKVLDHTRALHRVERIGEVGKALPLLSADDQRVLRIASQRLSSDGDECVRDLSLVAAVAEWVLRRRVIHMDPPARRQFQKLETELLDRKIALFRRLRTLIKDPAAIPATADEAGEDDGADPAAPQSRTPVADTAGIDWTGIRGDAELLADDMCMLLALYREHQIILPMTQTDGAAGAATRRLQTPTDTARAHLDAFVSHGDSDMDRGAVAARIAMLAVSWSFGVIVIICILWAALPGAHELRISFPTDPLRGNVGVPERLLTYLSNGIFGSFVPIVIGVAIWQGSTAAGNWGNGLRGNWTSSQPRALMVIFSGWVVATLLLSGVSIWWSATRVGWVASDKDALNTLIRVCGTVAPTALRGAFLAALVVECLDRYWQRPVPMPAGARYGLGAALRAAVIMGIAGVLTRWLTIEINISAPVATVTRRQVDAFDRGLMAYTGILSALTAFILIYALSQALRESRIPVARKSEPATKHENVSAGQDPTAKARTTSPERQAVAPTLLVALAILPALLMPAGRLAAEPLNIGVRTDARPYIWQDEHSKSYRGYLLDVCVTMAQRAGYDIRLEGVTAEERNEFLTRGEGEIDLLCDPTTITLGRVQGMLKPPINGRLTFLPIFHIATSSYLELAPTNKATRTAACDDGTATSEAPAPPSDQQWIRFWLPKEEAIDATIPAPSSDMWGAVGGTTSADRLNAIYAALDPPMKARVCIATAGSHKEAAEKLCSGEWRRYYGDEELIAAAVEALPQPCTPSRADAKERHYEPYALIVSNERHCGLDQILAAQLYAMGAEKSLEGKLRQHFKEASISASLQTLLALLALPVGQTVIGEAGPPPSGPCSPPREFGLVTTQQHGQ